MYFNFIYIFHSDINVSEEKGSTIVFVNSTLRAQIQNGQIIFNGIENNR
jgi:hypothetical protein